MSRQSLTNRVERLAKIVDDLQKEPARIDALAIKVEALDVQFVQLRGEMRAEFSATREEMKAGFARVETRFHQADERFGQVDARLDHLDARFATVGERFDKLETAIKEGDEETRREMRVLHEDLVARIALLREHFPPR